MQRAERQLAVYLTADEHDVIGRIAEINRISLSQAGGIMINSLAALLAADDFRGAQLLAGIQAGLVEIELVPKLPL